MLAEGVTLCCCCCCGEVGAACRRLLGPRRVIKINYLLLVLAFVVPVMLLSLLLGLLGHALPLSPDQVTARCSFALLLLFLGMLLLCLCHNRCAMVANEGVFTLKYALVGLLFLGSLFVSSGFFSAYAQAARVLSVGYLFIQSVILIDIFYIMGRSLVKRYEEGEEECGGILVGLSVLLLAAAATLNILAYLRFGTDGCAATTWLNIAVSVLLVALPAVQLLQLNPQNNLLTTSLVALLLAYLAHAAQLSLPNCTARLTTLNYLIDVAVNLLLFVLTTYGTIAGGLSQEPDPSIPSIEGKSPEDETREYSGNLWVEWHGYMCLASVYLCMVFSNWLAADVGSGLQGGVFAFWVRAGGCLATAAIYLWTMVAPALLPQRNFQLEED